MNVRNMFYEKLEAFKILEDKREAYRAVGMLNTFGKSVEERLEIDLLYRKAADELWEAEKKYRALIEKEVA